MGGTCSTYGNEKRLYGVLVGKPEGKRSHGRPIRIWEDNIKMDLQEVELGVIDWFDLVQERARWRHLHVNAVMNIGVP